MGHPDRTSPETRLGARTLAGLYAAGATLSLLTMVLPHSRQANDVVCYKPWRCTDRACT